MTCSTTLARAALLVALLAAGPAAGVARADGARADSTVEGYVRSMADSTDRWFGVTAQSADTTGLDSARTYFLAHPRTPPKHTLRLGLMPSFGFSRVLGPEYGLNATAGDDRGTGRLVAGTHWAAGPDLWLPGGDYLKRWIDLDAGVAWGVRIHVAREAGSMDRDAFDPGFSLVRAFVTGTDRTHYLLRDGARVAVRRQTAAWWAAVGGRDEFESPLATTASWYLAGHEPLVFRNDSALAGRVHEANALAGARVPWTPLSLEAQAWSAGGSLGGGMDYTRVRATLGGAVALGRHLALVPQADYGRLTGSAPPQEAFDLGGGSLRTFAPHSTPGTGRAIAHVDLMLTDPVQRLVGAAREPTFPVNVGVFAGTAARWGYDPATNRARLTARDWPERSEWFSEVGVSVMYRPGLPDPEAMVRIDWGVPIGPDGRVPRFWIAYDRPLNLFGKH